MSADNYEDVASGKNDTIPALEVPPQDLYHAKSFITRWIFSQDAKVIGIQYALTAVSIGLVALVLSWMMRLQLAFPELVPFLGPAEYYQFVTMHGMIMVVYLLTALFLGGRRIFSGIKLTQQFPTGGRLLSPIRCPSYTPIITLPNYSANCPFHSSHCKQPPDVLALPTESRPYTVFAIPNLTLNPISHITMFLLKVGGQTFCLCYAFQSNSM